MAVWAINIGHFNDPAHGGSWIKVRSYVHVNKHFEHLIVITVKPVLKGHSKIDKTKILMTNGSLMKVESITCLKRPLKNRQNKDLNDKW